MWSWILSSAKGIRCLHWKLLTLLVLLWKTSVFWISDISIFHYDRLIATNLQFDKSKQCDGCAESPVKIYNLIAATNLKCAQYCLHQRPKGIHKLEFQGFKRHNRTIFHYPVLWLLAAYIHPVLHLLILWTQVVPRETRVVVDLYCTKSVNSKSVQSGADPV